MPTTPRFVVGSVCALAGLLIAVGSTPVASAAKPPEHITIKIKRHPTVSLEVIPRGVGICKKANDVCSGQVEWGSAQGGGNGLKPGEYLKVRYKKTGIHSEACFATSEFVISDPAVTVPSGDVQEACPAPTVWFYWVELWSQGAKPDDPSDDYMLCEALDPGVIIDRNN